MNTNRRSVGWKGTTSTVTERRHRGDTGSTMEPCIVNSCYTGFHGSSTSMLSSATTFHPLSLLPSCRTCKLQAVIDILTAASPPISPRSMLSTDFVQSTAPRVRLNLLLKQKWNLVKDVPPATLLTGSTDSHRFVRILNMDHSANLLRSFYRCPMAHGEGTSNVVGQYCVASHA